MYNITLIFTHHSKLGKCNADELYKIIDAISPEVIFEELTKDLSDILYKGLRLPNEPPEIESIKRYLLNDNIIHIPVDINPNQSLRKEEIEYMFSFFQQYHFYKELEGEQIKMIEQDGFAFLNSEKWMELFEEKMILEERLMNSSINRNQLIRIHKLFYDEHDIRENPKCSKISITTVERTNIIKQYYLLGQDIKNQL